MNVLKNEPALVLGVLGAVLALFVNYGLLDAAGSEHLYAIGESVLLLIGALLVRSAVTPTNKL